MNKDQLTTYLGVAAGVASAIAQSNILPDNYSHLLSALSGILVALMGFYTNKS